MNRYLQKLTAWGSILLAIAALCWAFYLIDKNTPTKQTGQVRFAPPSQPAFKRIADSLTDKSRYIGGIGIVEPAGEAVSIGTEIPGIVIAVKVRPGDHVKRGDPLFMLDDRTAQANLAIAKASLQAAESKLVELQAQVEPLRAKVAAAEALLSQARADAKNADVQLRRAKSLAQSNAISAEAIDGSELAAALGTARVAEAEARLKEAQGNLALLSGNESAPTIDVQKAAIAQARANVEKEQTVLNLHTIRAPLDATVLQVKTRVGEFAPAAVLSNALMVLGITEPLHVRVDIDESEIPRFKEGSVAMASVRGRAEVQVKLNFVRTEPYVIPKRTLSGGVAERVDTRVLQVIYATDAKTLGAVPGQQVDVFIETSSNTSDTNPPPSPQT